MLQRYTEILSLEWVITEQGIPCLFYAGGAWYSVRGLIPITKQGSTREPTLVITDLGVKAVGTICFSVNKLEQCMRDKIHEYSRKQRHSKSKEKANA